MFNPSKHLRQFGIGVFLIAAFSRVLSALHLRKFFCAYTNWKHKYLSNWLWKRFAYTVKYDKDTKHEVEDEGFVFVFWYQGEKSAPPIVKACLASIRKWCPDRKVIVLDKNITLKNVVGKLSDIAPTILSIMGIDIPKEMNGEVLVEE